MMHPDAGRALQDRAAQPSPGDGGAVAAGAEGSGARPAGADQRRQRVEADQRRNQDSSAPTIAPFPLASFGDPEAAACVDGVCAVPEP